MHLRTSESGTLAPWRAEPVGPDVEFEDDAYILAARSFGETGAIVEMLTKRHGKYAAHVAGAASRKMKPFPAGRRPRHRPVPRPHRRPAWFGDA